MLSLTEAMGMRKEKWYMACKEGKIVIEIKKIVLTEIEIWTHTR